MSIQWYPGHMYKAGKEIKKRLPDMDLVIEVIDARIPFSSQNPLLMELAAHKPTIKVLNKSDLADEDMVKQWQDYFEQSKNIKSIAISANNPQKVKQIADLVREMFPEKKDHQFVSALIMGIPNVGKSTIINILADRTVAKTGNEPAVTKAQQRININDNFVLFDTPGMLWPKIKHENWGLRLATTGAIKETAMSHEDCAFYLVEYLHKHYPKNLMSRYEIETLKNETYDILEQIGSRRGCLKSGKRLDLHKVSSIIVTDYRSGSLGEICLENPIVVESEMKQAEILEEQRLAKKMARKKRRS